MEICKNSNCNDCQDRAAGLSPSVYNYWIEKCRSDYNDCSSSKPANCDKCWSDCTTQYATKSDINALNSCIDTCQKTDNCVDSTCGQCQLRTNNAISNKKLPQEWKNTMETKCISWYPGCIADGSYCNNCYSDCNGDYDCMIKQCKDCVPGLEENNCIGCEEFCSNRIKPWDCELKYCEKRMDENNCPIRDCSQCRNKCSFLTDPEQKSICDVLCLLNKDNKCNSDCDKCWNECSHITDITNRLTCEFECEHSESVGCEKSYSSESCLERCKEFSINQGEIYQCYANCGGTPYSFSLNSTPMKLTPTLPVTPIVTLTSNGRETGIFTLGAGTTRMASWSPAETRFYTGTTVSWPMVSIPTNQASNPGNVRAATGAGNPLTVGPLFYSNDSNANVTRNITGKINSSNNFK